MSCGSKSAADSGLCAGRVGGGIDGTPSALGGRIGGGGGRRVLGSGSIAMLIGGGGGLATVETIGWG